MKIKEFAPGGEGGAGNYYISTANFVNEYRSQKEEEIQQLLKSGWTENDLKQSMVREQHAYDIKKFARVRDGFLLGLKQGFDRYRRGGLDTQLKDALGCHWINDGLDLNRNWQSIYGQTWGRADNC